MDLRQSAIDRTKNFEQFIPHFYLDSTGHVTIGYGELISSANEAAGLVMASGSSAATAKEKRDAWAQIKGKPQGYKASWYAQFTTIRLSAAEGDKLITASLKSAIAALESAFTDIDDYPDAAQDALLDMMFNLGQGNFPADWPLLKAAVESQNWRTAAAQSNRPQLDAVRNAAIKRLFLDAGGFLFIEEVPTLLSLEEVFSRRVSEALVAAREAATVPKLFPGGINRIEINLSVGEAEFSLTLAGPEGPGEASSSILA